MNVKMIGAGAIFSKDNSACYLIDNKILIDIPNGTLKGILRQEIDISKLECILITHFHADHFFDLPFVLLSLFNKRDGKKSKPLYIVCNDSERGKVKDILNLSNFRSYEEFCDKLNIKIIGVKENNHKFDKVDGYVIRSYKVKHTAEAYGFVIEDNDNKRIGFTGDSCLCDGVEKIIKNSNAIFCDTSKLVGDDDAHMGCDNIIQLSSKYVNKKIITSHMYFDVKCEIIKLNIPNLIVGNDGLEINI